MGRCVGLGRGLGRCPVAGSFADRGYGFGLRVGAAAIVGPAETGAFTKLLAQLAEGTVFRVTRTASALALAHDRAV